MTDPETYTIEFTKREMWSLVEILGNFRKAYEEEKIPSPEVFEASAHLHFKIAKDMAEAQGLDSDKYTLDDFM